MASCGAQRSVTVGSPSQGGPVPAVPETIALHIHYRIFRTVRHIFFTPNLGGKWGCVLQSECSLHLHW